MATFFQEDEITGKAYDARIMRRLLTYVRPYTWLASLAMVLLILVSLIDLVGPALTYYGIDHFIVPKVQDLNGSQRSLGLLAVASVYIFVLILGFKLSYLYCLFLSIVGTRMLLVVCFQNLSLLPRVCR